MNTIFVSKNDRPFEIIMLNEHGSAVWIGILNKGEQRIVFHFVV